MKAFQFNKKKMYLIEIFKCMSHKSHLNFCFLKFLKVYFF